MAIKEFQTLMARMGVKALPPEEGLTALEHLLSTNSPQTTVADIDWTLFKRIYEARGARSLLAEIKVETPPGKEEEQCSEILQQLSEASESDRYNLLTVFLQKEVGAVLGLKASRLPDLHRGFFDLGMDSLMVVELIKRLETAFATSLSATLMFELPTIKNLVDYIGKKVLGWNTTTTEPEVEEPTMDLAELQQLSETELEASIAAQLAQLEDLVGGN
jgi:acyl carrier protein